MIKNCIRCGKPLKPIEQISIKGSLLEGICQKCKAELGKIEKSQLTESRRGGSDELYRVLGDKIKQIEKDNISKRIKLGKKVRKIK